MKKSRTGARDRAMSMLLRFFCGLRGGDFRSKFLEIKIVAADAQVFNDVGNNAARYVAGMPGEGNEPVGTKRIGIMPMAAGSAQQFASDLAEAAFKLAAIP